MEDLDLIHMLVSSLIFSAPRVVKTLKKQLSTQNMGKSKMQDSIRIMFNKENKIVKFLGLHIKRCLIKHGKE